MKKVLILTEGGKGIGFGHITRCSSIYQAFEELNFNPKMIINADNSIVELVKDFNCFLVDWINNFDSIINEITTYDIIFIDSYKASEELYFKINSLNNFCVYFDDFNRITYPKGIIINGALGAENLDYSNQSSKLLLGTKYTPLRKIFWEKSNKIIKENIESIMITFGGDDIRNLTPRVLSLLSNNFPNIIKNVIIGKSFTNIDEIKEIIDKNTNLYFNPNPSQLRDIMMESDIAISAGGQTLYELASVGTTTIVVSIAENQNNSIKAFMEKNFFIFVGNYNEESLMNKINTSIAKIKEYIYRLSISNRLNNLFYTNGSKNIVKEILDNYNNEN